MLIYVITEEIANDDIYSEDGRNYETNQLFFKDYDKAKETMQNKYEEEKESFLNYCENRGVNYVEEIDDIPERESYEIYEEDYYFNHYNIKLTKHEVIE